MHLEVLHCISMLQLQGLYAKVMVRLFSWAALRLENVQHSFHTVNCDSWIACSNLLLDSCDGRSTFKNESRVPMLLYQVCNIRLNYSRKCRHDIKFWHLLQQFSVEWQKTCTLYRLFNSLFFAILTWPFQTSSIWVGY